MAHDAVCIAGTQGKVNIAKYKYKLCILYILYFLLHSKDLTAYLQVLNYKIVQEWQLN